MQSIIKWFFITLGALAVLAGLITLWMPIPIGIPLMLMGLPLLMRYSPHARNWILSLGERYPKVQFLLDKFGWRRDSAATEKK